MNAIANACECLMNEMITQHVLANVFSLSLISQHLPSELLVSKVRMKSQDESLQMSYDHCKCLAISKKYGLRLLTNMLHMCFPCEF